MFVIQTVWAASLSVIAPLSCVTMFIKGRLFPLLWHCLRVTLGRSCTQVAEMEFWRVTHWTTLTPHTMLQVLECCECN